MAQEEYLLEAWGAVRRWYAVSCPWCTGPLRRFASMSPVVAAAMAGRHHERRHSNDRFVIAAGDGVDADELDRLVTPDGAPVPELAR